MPTQNMLSSLSLMTLLIVLVIAVVAYLLFLRKRSNRNPVEKPSLASQSMAPKEGDATE